MDLMALADALLLPQDDLALAAALKSPLFGLTEDELFALAGQRKGSLRDALRAQAADADIHGAPRGSTLCRAARAHETPFAFYAWLLGAERRPRSASCARLGQEANDALDEFLELALGYERKAPPRCRASWPGCAPPTPR